MRFNGFEKAKSTGDDLVQTSWVAQLKIHLPRFADLRDTWKTVPAVREMLAFDEGEEVSV